LTTTKPRYARWMQRPFHLLAKPTGAVCNLDCKYCFFLSKEKLYPNSKFRMTDEMLECVPRAVSLVSAGSRDQRRVARGRADVDGLPFFEKSIEYQRKHQRPGTRIVNTIQTNGVLLDDDWCSFFRSNDYLVGLSLDGPRELHDAYRVDKAGAPTFDKVMRGLRCLQKHGVDFNVLTTVHAKNADHPVRALSFPQRRGRNLVHPVHSDRERKETRPDTRRATRSRSALSAGTIRRTLSIGVFDEWRKKDIGTVFVQMFDVALAAWAGEPPSLCIFAPTCGDALALEHSGYLYSCESLRRAEHCSATFVTARWRRWSPPTSNARSEGTSSTPPQYCRDCSVRFACNGGCPRSLHLDPTGDPGSTICALATRRSSSTSTRRCAVGRPFSDSVGPRATSCSLLRRREHQIHAGDTSAIVPGPGSARLQFEEVVAALSSARSSSTTWFKRPAPWPAPPRSGEKSWKRIRFDVRDEAIVNGRRSADTED